MVHKTCRCRLHRRMCVLDSIATVRPTSACPPSSTETRFGVFKPSPSSNVCTATRSTSIQQSNAACEHLRVQDISVRKSAILRACLLCLYVHSHGQVALRCQVAPKADWVHVAVGIGRCTYQRDTWCRQSKNGRVAPCMPDACKTNGQAIIVRMQDKLHCAMFECKTNFCHLVRMQD